MTGDNTAPAPTNISASGGIAGRPEVGDVLTLTTNDTLDTYSLLANWTGAATTVQVRFVNQGGGDRLQVWDSAGTTQIPFGTINLGRNDFTTSTLAFNGSTMTQSGGVITITLGAPVVGTVTTVARRRHHGLDPVGDRDGPRRERDLDDRVQRARAGRLRLLDRRHASRRPPPRRRRSRSTRAPSTGR